MPSHERWFTAGQFPLHIDLGPGTLIPVAVAAGITATAVIASRIIGRKSLLPALVQLGVEPKQVSEVLKWMPVVLGLHTAVPLLVSGVGLKLFVPNLALPWHIISGVLGLAQIMIALSFVYGFLTRLAAIGLMLVWLAGAAFFGPVLLLEQSIFLGVAFFLLVAGRGPMAVDMTIHRLERPLEPLVPYAVPALRIATGVSIVVLSFTEKLWNMPLALSFLAEHPFNFLPALGFEGVSDATFIRMAGAVELTFGLVLCAGVFIRSTILLLWLPFNLTVPFLGWRELVGHLPIYGVMALLLIWGAGRSATDRAFIQGVRDHEDRGREQEDAS